MTNITEEEYICEACFDVSMQSINAQIHGNNECHPSACSSRLGHTQVCPVCGRSLLNRQSDYIHKENPSSLTLRMINLIRATVAPRQISQYDRVCHACWLRFKRQALLTQQQDERRGLEGDETPHGQEEVEQPVDAVHVPELQPPPFLASTDERDSSVESVAAPEHLIVHFMGVKMKICILCQMHCGLPFCATTIFIFPNWQEYAHTIYMETVGVPFIPVKTA
ncbi:unnamed protein product [Parnassius apollo]|uniref:(apollo) hypothetical protein n=1 Tax=Parnassius apollo TaxID=110799 RepID=A0A8S3XGA8_PARAO|nr:unnamed protein product [Parnassius apollo]